MSTPASTQTPERILQRLDWKVVRRLDGLLQGDYRSLFYGNGIDFADLREYQADDDVRFIDWNVTARMDVPHVRKYVEDREITAWFLLDLSPSIDFGTVQHHKRAMLIDFVTSVARVLTKHGNRVGAVLYSGATMPAAKGAAAAGAIAAKVIPARGGRLQVLRLINDLLKQTPLARAPFTDLTPMFESALRSIKRRALVFVVSDFISAPGWETPLRLLTRRHEVLAVRLWDPREVELPDIGPMLMEDAETGEQLYVDTHDKKFRQRFKEAALAREAALSDTLKRAGVDALALSTEDDVVRALLRFAARRKKR